MKKNLKKLATLTLAFTVLTTSANLLAPQSSFANNVSSIETVYANTNAITVNIDGKKVDFSKYGAEPFIKDGTTYVPLRSVFEAFGAVERTDKTLNPLGILYANDTNMYMFDKNVNGYDIEFTLNIRERMEPLTLNSYYVAQYRKDGASALYDFKKNDLILQNGRTFVPLRLISEVFGYKVDWNGTTKTISIDTSNPTCIGFDRIDEKIAEREKNNANKSSEIIPSQKPVQEPTEIKTDENKNVDVTSDDIQKANTLMLEKVNALRAENGVAPLVLDEKLINLAKMKADDMVENNYYGHVSPIYGRPYEMYDTVYNTKNSGVGENITKTFFGKSSSTDTVVEASFKSWLNSNGHKENMLNPKYTKIGFAYKILTDNDNVTSNVYDVMMLQF